MLCVTVWPSLTGHYTPTTYLLTDQSTQTQVTNTRPHLVTQL